jgi:poly(hydroxyalkanoate) granule-associated protein
MVETQKTMNGGKAMKVPEFLREPLEAAQARLEQIEVEAQRVLKDLVERGRASRKDLEHMVQKLSKQDWTFPEMKQRIDRLREQGVERAAEWRGKAETFRAEALEGDLVPRRRDPRAGGGDLEGARPADEADREGRALAPDEEGRGLAMPGIQEMFKEAWSSALAGVNAAEQEAEKVLGKVADAAGFSPDEVKRQAREFGERLTVQRREIEKAIDDAVRRAANRFRIPTQSDIEALQKRVDAVAERVEALSKERPAG